MVGAISGAGSSAYLSQIRQMMTNSLSTGGSNQIISTKLQAVSKSRSLSLDDIFGKLDSDGDGVISKDEFAKAKSATAGKITEALTDFESNSTASLVSLLKTTGQVTGNTGSSGTGTPGNGGPVTGGTSTDQIFGRIDANSDGVISREEFETARSAAETKRQTRGTDTGEGAAASTAGSSRTATGAASTLSPFAAQEATAKTVQNQANALLQQAISQYRQLSETGRIPNTMGNLYVST